MLWIQPLITGDPIRDAGRQVNPLIHRLRIIHRAMNGQPQTYGDQQPQSVAQQPRFSRREAWSRAWRRHRDLVRTTWLVAIIAAVQAIAIVILFRGAPHTLILHYTTDFGIDRVGPWWHLFSVPILLLGLAVVNGFVGGRVSTRLSVAPALAMAADVVLGLGWTAALALLILVNQSAV